MTGIAEMMAEADRLTAQIVALCNPKKIILFGSAASGVIRRSSDIDLCIIAEYSDKRALLTNLYAQLESEVGVDLVLYSPEDWEKNCQDTASFAHIINLKGKLLYG